MAVFQHNKSNVYPVLNFHELNGHVSAYTAHVVICVQKLREWQKKGSTVFVLNLRMAYL